MAFIVLVTVAGITFYRTRVLPEADPAGGRAVPSSGSGHAEPSSVPSSGGSRTAGAPSTGGSTASPVPLSPAGREAARVVWVSDGDTIVVKPLAGPYATHEQRIRLIGLDAPEMHPEPQCWARESTAALLKLVPRGSTVTMAFDDRKFDDYGRQLRYVWNAAGTLVNGEQLARGDAFLLRIWPNVRHEKAFENAAAGAQRARRGLWGSCPNPQPPVHTPKGG
jgi:micrococcal nuclease